MASCNFIRQSWDSLYVYYFVENCVASLKSRISLIRPKNELFSSIAIY